MIYLHTAAHEFLMRQEGKLKQLLSVLIFLMMLTASSHTQRPDLTFAGDVGAQTRDSLVGAWRLVSASSVAASGSRNDAPYGSAPKGILTYTREGRMTAIISFSGRKPLSKADLFSAPVEERAEAFATFFAYAGRYSLSGDKVTHHVEISSVENLVNTDLVRFIKFEDGRIRLRTPPASIGGTMQTFELVWERVE